MPTAPSPSLRIALWVFGLLFVFGVYPLAIVWPAGWTWTPGVSPYLQMIIGIYATLGVFVLRAVRDPSRHLSLLWFVVWSSLVHAAIMGIHALLDANHIGHLWGDVAALMIVAVVLGALLHRYAAESGVEHVDAV